MNFAQIEAIANELICKNNLEEIHQNLVRSGINSADAARALVFIPSAFAKEFYEPQGIEFPAKFTTTAPDGKTFIEHSYSEEPIYGLACQLARLWIDTGKSSHVLRILAWSAELKLIEGAKARGLTPSRMSQINHNF
jgi:hypothetical protein